MNYSSKFFQGDRPYVKYEEYLEDLYLYVLIYLRKYIVNVYGTSKEETEPASLRFPSYTEVLHLVTEELKQKDIDDDQELQDWHENMTGRRELSGVSGKSFPIDTIIHKLGLDDFAVFTLILSLMGSLSKKYQRVFQYINRDSNGKYPTLEICAKIYYYKEDLSSFKLSRYIYSKASEFKILYPELASEDHFGFGELICDERLIDLLLGQERVYTKGVHIIGQEMELDPILYRDTELNCLIGFIGDQDYPLFFLYGDKGVGKKHLVKHFARMNQTEIVIFDIKSLAYGENIDFDSVIEALKYAVRECVIKTLPLAITSLERMKENDLEQLVIYIKETIKQVVQLIFLISDQVQFSSRMEGIYTIELVRFTELQRIELWKYYTRDYELEDDFNIDELANTFVITPGQIIGATNQAALLSGGTKTIQEKLLYKACYAQLDHKLAEKTSKVKTSFEWDDLKMADQEKEVLRDICNCVKNKHIVLNEWNFSKIIPYGDGLTVLFSGPPGTGKTMAAQVIANELKMELYKIDLSQIFDKYVGETEKNIRQIFDQAQKSNGILFFDEADSIFSKRLEASNANDRFANIESSMLLQYIEEYSGISILATNNVNSIDSAFMRRFKYYILFREPDEEERFEIWKAVIPKEAPVSNDVDLRLLAKQFQFTGAVIKNVILSAAYMAAEKKEAISIIDILRSIKREMYKNNLILTKDKLGSLGYLFDDIN